MGADGPGIQGARASLAMLSTKLSLNLPASALDGLGSILLKTYTSYQAVLTFNVS